MGKTRFSSKLLHPRYWLTWFGISLWWLVVQILPFRWQMALGAKLGRLAARLSRQRCLVARRNLELCFPELSEQEREKLFWRSMESIGRGFFDTGIAWFWPYSRLKKILETRGLEHLESTQSAGHGVLFCGFHFTSLEMIAPGINRLYDQPTDGVYRPHNNLAYDYVQRKGRERHYPALEAVVVPRKDVRGMVKSLRKGRALVYLPDQDYGRKYSIFAPFFGIQAATVPAPSQLARMGKAKVMAFLTARKHDGSGYLVQVFPALEGFGEGDEVADAAIMNSFIEKLIREYPEQYLWVHRRFKTRPEGEEDVYGRQARELDEKRRERRRNRQRH